MAENRRRFVFLSASLILHLLLFFGPTRPPPTTVPQNLPVEVELKETAGGHGGSPPSTVGESRRRTRDQAVFPTKKLKALFFPSTLQELAENRVRGKATVNLSDDDETFSPNEENVFGDATDSAFYRAIFDRIDSNLVIESRMATTNHLGRMTVTFDTNNQGVLYPDSIRVQSEDPILKVYILRILRRALKEPLHANVFSKTGKDRTMRAHFFLSYGDPERNTIKQSIFVKPVFNFYRLTSERPAATNLQDQLTSGGIDYDPFRLYDSWERYNKVKKWRENEFDPFQDLKRDPDYDL